MLTSRGTTAGGNLLSSTMLTVTKESEYMGGVPLSKARTCSRYLPRTLWSKVLVVRREPS